MIQKTWETQKAIKEVMVFLQSHGVSTTYAVKIFKQYGASSICTVTNNPYQLATDIYGIGFITADKIVRNIGVPSNSEYRYKAGIIHVLSDGAEDGHCYLPHIELVQKLVQLLKIDDYNPNEESAELIIRNMGLEDELIRESGADKSLLCYKPTYFHTEQNLADLIYSEKILVVRLTQLFRQPQESAIIRSAHQINQGEFPILEPITYISKSDSLWHGGGYQPEHGVQAICDLITDFIPSLGFNPATDVQLLCPMTCGLVGVRNLNNVL
ncbi:RecD/TraA family helicase (plasmid) [Calothrix sp. NIES-4071]|nr:RecD/TraA family helicase [Calothrix sp. NIES-4071]BAZ64775.1 RecD/TraA family helicase [Calothrix sp. NIES-4105]